MLLKLLARPKRTLRTAISCGGGPAPVIVPSGSSGGLERLPRRAQALRACFEPFDLLATEAILDPARIDKLLSILAARVDGK
jgi:hypothetical protein